MKKIYIKPVADIIDFDPKDAILNVDITDPSFGDEGVEEW